MAPRKTENQAAPTRTQPQRTASKRKASEDLAPPPPPKVAKKTAEVKAPVKKPATKTAATKTAATKAAATKAAATKPAATKTAATKTAATKAAATKTAATKTAVTKTAATKTAATKTATTKAAATKTAVTKTAAKKAPVKKAQETATMTTTTRTGTKRKATEDIAAAPLPKVPRIKKGAIINERPTTKLDVYVFGGGSFGELGLGSGPGVTNVKRPRLNPLLSNDEVGVVQIAVGGMHCAALTHDNKIYTWGVNDQGALGRDTTWEGGMRDMDGDQDSDQDSVDEGGLNPRESTPTAIPSDAFPEGVQFTEVACGDSNTFAVTDDGRVYGWGTFRSNEGILGFTDKTLVQLRPALIPELKGIKTLATGSNHVLALDTKGKLYAWGCGQQNQLGRRIVERTRTNGLTPRPIGVSRKPLTTIACGDYHSFAVDAAGAVWSWGLNSYGQTGIRAGAGEPSAIVPAPALVEALSGSAVRAIRGAKEHSVAVTADGDCLVWGRLDGHQTGLAVDSVPAENLIRDEAGRPRIVAVPTVVPGIRAAVATAGGDTSLAVTPAGEAYSWGFSMDYQTGQGTDDDVEVPTLIDNSAVRGKVLNWGGLGGQFGVLTGPRVAAN